jgi:tRNA threonylcarbamoyladenosine biosynthesis protein TsaB
MAILAIETATDACSVALATDGAVFTDHRVVPRGHNRLLLPMIDGLLAGAGLRRSQLSLVAFGRGPGSFTGVRIAAAAAQGIALGLDLPVVRVSTLEILAHTAHRLCPSATGVVTAQGSRASAVLLAVYTARTDGLAATVEAHEAELDAVVSRLAVADTTRFVVAGDRRDAIIDLASRHGLALADSTVEHPQACDLLPLARRERDAGRVVAPQDAIPDYLDRSWPRPASG